MLTVYFVFVIMIAVVLKNTAVIFCFETLGVSLCCRMGGMEDNNEKKGIGNC